jgi:hypothetical protein
MVADYRAFCCSSVQTYGGARNLHERTTRNNCWPRPADAPGANIETIVPSDETTGVRRCPCGSRTFADTRRGGDSSVVVLPAKLGADDDTFGVEALGCYWPVTALYAKFSLR